ncbi:DUF4062 domain-containing protein [Pantoea coffeiphila]|uniref:DUF4062 domain-containing protein n=1 Tax=Pantoea coffeiphila TaxID=1465635 RepID=A0A2S9I852_9GAMM|nr:DUF4062 domain-containing protein [Pantoea coffeiphila]PRD13961.1 hypothetical protein CQW29_18310 [Pantoea coffeiphila]
MDKRYQVFVSSTFADLQSERTRVIQTLMEMDCIPAGMELFPAIDEEQWEFIKKVIDDCDYYLLIIGGRYGSVAEDGLSYTEKEFDYAIEKGLKVTVLLHEDPDSLPARKTESTPELRGKLLSFIEKAQTGRLRRTWKSVDELPGLVALSMTKTIKTYPAVGWVRADKLSSESDLRAMIDLQKENEKLKMEIASLSSTQSFELPENISGLDSLFTITYTSYSNSMRYPESQTKSIEKSFSEIFSYLSPAIFKICDESTLRIKMNEFIDMCDKKQNYRPFIEDDVFQVIILQFLALKLMTLEAGLFSLTDLGKKTMMSLKLVKDRPHLD